ncbi:hypothetical protein B0H17DRAFT_194043 [Mycena rosella]|uniref:Uncharacterized protein n=1 Tax=Mycena rosella TaxID=1033263 RepID=A0AAD7D0U1_MYCRO|nr:hypothetical protein B0H17DRAFT_194043 [Mycena rosella]
MFRLFGFIPHSTEIQVRGGVWHLIRNPYHRSDILRSGVPCGEGVRPQSLVTRVKLDVAQVQIVHQTWLSQANKFVPSNMSDGDRWGVIDTISCRLLFDQAFEHVLRTDGTFTDAHLFVCPLQVASHEPRFTLALPESGHYHWALDSTRNTRMSLENSDALSLPRFRFNCAHGAPSGRRTITTLSRNFTKRTDLMPIVSMLQAFLNYPSCR